MHQKIKAFLNQSQKSTHLQSLPLTN